jgi:DNA-binding transcriptional LysR family regulator
MPRPVNLSLELLRTFTTLVETEGDAVLAAERLEVNQPSMSKRLRYLQHSGKVLEEPWVVREGKTWRLTPKGQEVLPAVQEIVRRYEQLARFAGESKPTTPSVSLACGQLAATGLVRDAKRQFSEQNPHVPMRIAMPRGRLRIRGVAAGSFDMALVTHDKGAIQQIAKRRLHVEIVETDQLALVCAEHSEWAAAVKRLPKTKVSPQQAARFPLILPEPDAGLRKQLDRVFKHEGLFDELKIAMEVGGWKVILEYVRDGGGVGIISEAAVRGATDLICRGLDPEFFRPSELKLICRYRLNRPDELDLSPEADAFRECLVSLAEKRREYKGLVE